MADLEVKDTLDLRSNVVVPYDENFNKLHQKRRKKQEDEF